MPINCFEFRVCRAGEPCNCSRIGARAATQYNVDWLRRCSRNPAVLSTLRGLASAGKSLSDNESLFRLIAGKIASGELRVCQGQIAVAAGGDPGTDANVPDSKPFPFTPKSKTSSGSALRPNENDPQTLPDDLNAAAQAAALTSAANQGAPFCPE